MDNYVMLGRVYIEDSSTTADIAQALVNAGYTVAFSLDYSEIYIMEDNKYDRK